MKPKFPPHGSHLLAVLSPTVRDRLLPHLERAGPLLGEVMYESSDSLRYTQALITQRTQTAWPAWWACFAAPSPSPPA